MELDIGKIREVICATRGGWESVSDEAVLELWRSLSREDQAAYQRRFDEANVKTPRAKPKDK